MHRAECPFGVIATDVSAEDEAARRERNRAALERLAGVALAGTGDVGPDVGLAGDIYLVGVGKPEAVIVEFCDAVEAFFFGVQVFHGKVAE